MESLVLRGHASLSEDVLTASLHDLLADLSDVAVLSALLDRCEALDEEGRPTGRRLLRATAWDRFSIEAWPVWQEGIPDLVVRIRSGDRVMGLVVIEVKYGAPKSGADVDGDAQLRDQLAWYLIGADRIAHEHGADAWGVVYLTQDPVPPVAELAASWVAARTKTSVDPTGRLAWISWMDVDHVLANATAGRPDDVAARCIARHRALLRAAGLGSFEGWQRPDADGFGDGSTAPLDRWAICGRWSGWRRSDEISLKAPESPLRPGTLWLGWQSAFDREPAREGV